jgi:hypothetical protein
MRWHITFFGAIALGVGVLAAGGLPLLRGAIADRPAEPDEPQPLGGWSQVDAELGRLGPAINSGAIPIANGECSTAMDGDSLELWLACGPDAEAMLAAAPLDGSTRSDDRPRSESTLPPHVLDALKGWVDGMIAGEVGAEETAVFLYDADSDKVATWAGSDPDAFLTASREQLGLRD